MAKQLVNIGQAANDRNGDPLRTAFDKINHNFNELYTLVGSGGGSASVTVANVPPDSPTEGSLWWNTEDGKTYIYYSGTWVDTSSPSSSVTTDRLSNGLHEVVLGSDGSLTLPGGTSKITTTGAGGESVDLVAGPGGWSELASNNGNNYVWVNDTGSYIATNASSTANIWTFTSDGKLGLPEGGDIVDSLGNSVLGGSGASTGNFTFTDNLMYNFNGTFIDNSDLTHNATSALILPSNSSDPNPAQLNNFYGAVELNTGYNNANTWTFDTDGNLTVPGEIHSAAGTGNVVIEANNGTARTWTFGGDGTLNLPEAANGIAIIQSANHIQLNANSKVWSFATNGVLTIPENGDIRNSTGTSVLGGGLTVADFGEGFSLNGASKIVTNKLYSTNETQPTQHYRLELDTNGVVHLPDQSIINGATLKSVAGNYAGITAGPVGKDEDSWMWVDSDGAWIATKYNTDQKLWQFDNNGALTFPSGAGFVKGDSGQLKVNDGTTLSLDIRDNYGRGFYTNNDGFSLRGNGSNTWKFGTDGKLTFPDNSVQTTAYQTTTAPGTSKGVSGNKVGMVAFDSSNFYYCKQDYTDGVDDIWVKVAWTSVSW